MRYRFEGYWDLLCINTLIAVELNPPQPTVSDDILILLPNRLAQPFYLNLTRLMREGFCWHLYAPIGIKGIKQSDG